MVFSFDKEQTPAPKTADQEVIRYLDPATGMIRKVESGQTLPPRMRFAPTPRKIEDRE